jgi:hypothetical protein
VRVDAERLSNAFASESFAPLSVTRRTWFHETKAITVDQLVGYLQSWSSYQTYLEARAQGQTADASEPLDTLELLHRVVRVCGFYSIEPCTSATRTTQPASIEGH